MAEGIPYGEKLIQSLELSLGAAFHQPHLRLTRRQGKYGPGFRVELQDEGLHARADDGVVHRVLEVFASDGRSTGFYFAFAAVFEVGEITRNHVLQHASLIAFHNIYAGELTSLFRAEWDEKAASDAVSEHAQPHWHFVQSPDRIENIVRCAIAGETKFIGERRSELFVGPDCGKFHFAMAPLWDKERTPSYKQMFEAGDFQDWFAELTKYIAGQIAYLIRHAPRQEEFTSSNP